METFDDKFFKMIEENPNKYAADYENALLKVKNSTAYYHGEPVPFLLSPMVWEDEDIEAFKEIARLITQITDKLTDAYRNDSEIRKLFGFSPLAEKLILRKKGYERNAPIGRYDIFYNSPGDFKFCEINTDGSSAMNEDNTIGKILMETEAIEDYSERTGVNFTGFELIDSWIDELLKYYKEWGGNNPKVAICDFIESGTSAEFEVFKTAIEKRGIKCVICDPRETVYKNGKLYYEGEIIDLIYRRIVTFELLEKADEISDFLDAYMDNAFCSVGEVRSQIMHHKKSFEIIQNPKISHLFNEEERGFIDKHFPKTYTLRRCEKQRQYVLENRRDLVLKPFDKNASQGVFIGRDMTQDEWERVLDEVSGTGYLFQEFVVPPKRKHTVFKYGKPYNMEFGSVTGLFLYDGKFKGIYTRVSENNLISGITDYYTLPNFLMRKND